MITFKEKTVKPVSFGKRFAANMLVLIAVSALIWLFITAWFSGGDFAASFEGERIVDSFALLGVVVFLFLAVYGFVFFFAQSANNLKDLTLIYFVILLTLILSVVAADKLNVFAMPLSLCAILVYVLVNKRAALACNIILSELLIVVFMIKTPFAADTMASVTAAVFCNTMSGFVLIYLLNKNYTRIKFVLVALLSGIIMAPFAAVVSLAMDAESVQLIRNTLWVLGANTITMVLYMPILPVFESVFNVVTDYRLDELCNFSQPLLKKLAEVAPGTFNHSIVVGTLAENCAVAIGENPHLARASAYYHDVGKMRSPEYFIENQTNGINPHDDLIPEVSVSMITKHTRNGAAMIRQHRLPEELAKAALEHHGTSPVNYFYYKAQKITEGQLGVEDYRYEGPKPSSKNSAIIMICDTVEAAARAISPDNKEELARLIDKLVKEKMDYGQFDDCDITMGDLTKIKKTITDVLPGIHHTRIKYKND